MLRPKVLYVDVNSQYLNPTRQLLWQALSAIYDVSFFGPGYSQFHELQAGLQTYIKTNGPFHHVFTTSHIALNACAPSSYDLDYPKIFYFNFPIQHLSTIPDIKNAIYKLEQPVSLFIIDLDLWNINSHTLGLLDHFSYLFGMGKHLWPSTSLSLITDIWSQKANDHWLRYLSTNSHRIIDFPHFISPSETIFPSSPSNHSLWSVPGVHYRSRQNFYLTLRNFNIKPARSSLYRYIAKLRLKGLFSCKDSFLLQLSLQRYRHIISSNTFSFACGSSVQMPLRKFFEIPAFGALLVCDKIPSLSYLGFIDGENCIVVDNDPITTLQRIFSFKTVELDRIRQNGQAHILKYHSLHARAALLKSLI